MCSMQDAEVAEHLSQVFVDFTPEATHFHNLTFTLRDICPKEPQNWLNEVKRIFDQSKAHKTLNLLDTFFHPGTHQCRSGLFCGLKIYYS